MFWAAKEDPLEQVPHQDPQANSSQLYLIMPRCPGRGCPRQRASHIASPMFHFAMGWLRPCFISHGLEWLRQCFVSHGLELLRPGFNQSIFLATCDALLVRRCSCDAQPLLLPVRHKHGSCCCESIFHFSVVWIP
jgi:hypothetical protein